MSSSFYRYTVLRDIEGRVVAILNASRPDDSIESINPLQFILADEVFGLIGKGVGKLLGSLVRKAAKLKVAGFLAAEMMH